MNQIAAEVDEPAREAALVLNGLEPEVVPGQAGRKLDQEASAGIVVAALAGSSAWRRRSPSPSTSRM